MAGNGVRRAWMRRGGVLILAGLVLVVVLVMRWRQDSDPDRVFLRADAAFKAGRLAEAEAMLRRLGRLRAPTPVDRFLRAEVAQALNDEDRALEELAAIPDDHPVAPLARLRSGQIEIRRGRTRPAEAAFKASLRLLPRAVPPRKELVYIYNIQHRQAELDAMLAELMDLDALDFAYVLHWTKTRNTVWNPKGDLPALERFVAADPEDRWSRLSLVEALRRLDRLEEAEKALAPLPESDPEARAERVLLAMDRGDFARAESLLAGGPGDHPGLARLRGQLALRRRDGEAAARQFRIAIAADPIDRLALHGLGTALGMLGQADAARPYLEAARRHDALWALVARAATTEGENDPRMPHQLGMACAATGRNLEARAWLRLAVRRDPLDAEGQKALFQLEHGQPGSRDGTTEARKGRQRSDGTADGSRNGGRFDEPRTEGKTNHDSDGVDTNAGPAHSRWEARRRRAIVRPASPIRAIASIDGSGAGTTALGSTGGAMVRVVVNTLAEPMLMMLLEYQTRSG